MENAGDNFKFEGTRLAKVLSLDQFELEVLWICPWCRLLSPIWDLHDIWIRIGLFLLGEPDP